MGFGSRRRAYLWLWSTWMEWTCQNFNGGTPKRVLGNSNVKDILSKP